VPLIAETGGINAMIVDSTALPEQVTDAVVQSAFRSAGQRCSALRLLCVHDSVADGVIAMIRGALQELTVGDPARLATDVGPLIDGEAFDAISGHVARLRKEALLIGEAPLPTAASCALLGTDRVRARAHRRRDAGDLRPGAARRALARRRGDVIAQVNALATVSRWASRRASTAARCASRRRRASATSTSTAT
jgi:RHH-type proline utilization regulon transcriptional repressor/proline dehydrogenase/delta 1-pyrroline-5-carboxylate dehydrogenase